MFSCLQQFLLHLIKDLNASGCETKIEKPGSLQGLKTMVDIYHIQILGWAFRDLGLGEVGPGRYHCRSLLRPP